MALSRGLRLLQFLDDWLIRSQSQEEAQVNTQAVVDLTQSLGWIINRKKSELNLLRCFFIRGQRIPSRFSPCKTHSREMAQLQDLILRLKSKHVLTARFFFPKYIFYLPFLYNIYIAPWKGEGSEPFIRGLQQIFINSMKYSKKTKLLQDRNIILQFRSYKFNFTLKDHVTLKARHIPGCLNVMADHETNRMVTASAGVQTDL